MSQKTFHVLPALAALALIHCPSVSVVAEEWTAVKADDLSEWSDPGMWWRSENGVFIAESEGGESLPEIHYLEWKGSTGLDFELTLEYRIAAESPQDAGVCFRVEQPHDEDSPNLPGYQAELDTGVLYGNQAWVRQGKFFGHIHDGKRSLMFKRSLISTAQPNGQIITKPLPKRFVPGKVFRKPPEWNHCRVVAVGDHVQLFLNGVLANEIYDQDPKNRSTGDGIALQYRPNDAYRFEVRDLKFRKWTSTLDHQPSTGSVEQASALAESGDFAAAAQMLEQVFAADPSTMDTMSGLGLATLYAVSGQKDKHRQFCENFMHRFSKWKLPEDAERPAKAYLLFPGADDVEMLKKSDAATRHAVQHGRGGMRVWFELSRGMAQYRIGDYAGVATSLSRPLRGEHPAQRIGARAFAAMAAYQLGQESNARRLIAEAEEELRRADRSELSWNNVVASQIAIDEAKALIK